MGQVHALALQDSPAGHAVLHAPQFVTLVVGSTQLWPHWVSAPQPAAEHAPCAQTWPEGHAVPQAPQFCASDFVSTQLAPHIERPDMHWQLLAPHVSPVVQALLHAPQLALLLVRSTQAVPHMACPAGQPALAPPAPLPAEPRGWPPLVVLVAPQLAEIAAAVNISSSSARRRVNFQGCSAVEPTDAGVRHGCRL